MKQNDATFAEDIERRHRELRPSVVLVSNRPALCSEQELIKAMARYAIAGAK